MRRIVIVATFCILATAIAYAAISRIPGPSFTLDQVVRMNGQDEANSVRSYNSAGEWKETTTYLKTGKQRVQIGTASDGVVTVNEEKKENSFIGGWAPPSTEEQIKGDPSFAGESIMLGYRVLLVRLESKTDGSVVTQWRAPELHGAMLKLVIVDGMGNTMSLEPREVKLEAVEVKAPDYTVSYDFFNKKQQTVELQKKQNDEAWTYRP